MAKQVFHSDKWACSLAHILISSDRLALAFRFWGFWEASCSFVPADILGLFPDGSHTDPILALETAITLIHFPQYFVDRLAELKAFNNDNSVAVVNSEPFQTEQDLIIPVELPVVVQPKADQKLRVYDKSLEIFESLSPLNFDALQIALDQFVHWFKTCPYSRSTDEKRRVFDDAVSSISKEFNLTPPQSKNYFWGVQQRLGLLP